MTPERPGEMPWLQVLSAEDKTRTIEALYRAHRLVSAITELDTLLLRIMEESKDVAHAEACSLMLFDDELEELYFHVTLGDSGEQQERLRRVRLKLGQGIAGAAAAARKSVNVPDADADPRFFKGADDESQFRTRNLLAVPLVDRDALIGVLEVVNKVDAPAFTDADLHVMEMFSSLAATAIANARLIESNLRRERFAAIGLAITGMSHYVKNIITGMSGGSDLMEQALDTGNLDVARRTWPVFNRSAKRIAHFVQDMLSYSKPRVPMREECDLADVIAEAEETFSELFVRKRVTLAIDTAGLRGPVMVDRQGIYRCLLNLLTNAADAVPAEGGEIAIAARAVSADDIEITVRDNGPGIPRPLREQVFEPFFSTKGAHGTGLGLAVTRKVIREHGGEMRYEDGLEGGAVFRITLPAFSARPMREVLG